MASSGGQITLRVALAGDDVIKARLAQLGPAGAAALRQIEQASAGPSAGMKALDAAAKDVTGSLEGMAGNVGPLGSALTAVGPAGLAAAAAIGAIITAAKGLADVAVQTADWAESVQKAATTIGTTAVAVQQLDIVAVKSGTGIDTMRTAVQNLNEKLGQAQAGILRPQGLKAFEALGFTPEQLKSYKDVESFLEDLIPRLDAVASASEKAGIMARLGIEPLAATLPELAGEFRDLKDATDGHRIATDEEIARLADLKRQLDDSNQKLDEAKRAIGSDFVPVVIYLNEVLADSIGLLADFWDAMNGRKVNATYGEQQAASFAARATVAGGQVLEGNWPAAIKTMFTTNPPDPANAPAVGAAAGAALKGLLYKPPPFTLTDVSGGKHANGPTADELAQQGRKIDDQADTDALKAQKDLLSAELSLTADINARADIQKQINAIADAEQKDASDQRIAQAKDFLDKVNASKTSTDAEKRSAFLVYSDAVFAEQLAQARQAQVQQARDQLAQQNKTIALDEQQFARDQQDLQGQIALDQARLAITYNMQDRRKLALEIFDLEEQEKEAQLKLTLAKQQAANDVAGAAITQAQIDNLEATQGARRQGVSNQNPANAWDAWVQKQKQDLPTLQGEWAQMKADGIDAFNSSLFDSEGRIQSFGQIMHNVLAKMLVDIEQYLLKQAEVGAFGGGGGGGFNPGSLIMSLFGGGGGGGVGGIGSAISSVGSALSGLTFDTGGRVPGVGAGAAQLIVAHEGETVMTRQVSAMWGPMLDAMNAGRPFNPPGFAAGGRVGGGGFAGFGSTQITMHIDRSIHAPGADPGNLQRIVDRQDDWERSEPQRWAAYGQAFGAIPKSSRRPMR